MLAAAVSRDLDHQYRVWKTPVSVLDTRRLSVFPHIMLYIQCLISPSVISGGRELRPSSSQGAREGGIFGIDNKAKCEVYVPTSA